MRACGVREGLRLPEPPGRQAVIRFFFFYPPCLCASAVIRFFFFFYPPCLCASAVIRFF